MPAAGSLLLWALAAAAAACWVYRERSWAQQAQQARTDLAAALASATTLNATLLALQQSTCCMDCRSILLQARGSGTCVSFGDLSDEDKSLFCGSAAGEDPVPQEPVAIAVIPDPALLDGQGLLQLLLLLSVMQLEFHFAHDWAGREVDLDGAAFRALRLLVSRHYPLTMTLVLSLGAAGSALSWWGLLPMSRFAFGSAALKTAALLWLSTGLSFCACNLFALIKYLPRSRDAFERSARDPGWWLWLGSRLLGLRDVASAATVLWWALTWALAAWPLRYLFFYRHVALAAYLADPRGADATAVDVFVVNVAGQTALQALLFYAALGLLALGADTGAGARAGTIGARVAALYARLLAFGRDRRALIALFLPACLNALALALRLAYFLVTARGTWYAWWVLTVGVGALHASLFLCVLFACQHLVQRNELDEKLRVQVEARIATAALDALAADRATTGAGAHVEEAHTRAAEVAREIFERSLERAVQLSYLTQGLQEASADGQAPGQGQGGDGESSGGGGVDPRLLGIFHAVLQTEAFAFAQEPAPEGNGDAKTDADGVEGETQTKTHVETERTFAEMAPGDDEAFNDAQSPR